MAKYQKGKYNFTLKGVKYKDISGFNYDDRPQNVNINVAGTAQMVRQWMKQKYPQIPSSYYWVRSESYSGGDSIRVYLNDAPEDLFDKINKELNMEFEEGTFNGMDDSYTYSKDSEKSDEGLIVDYGTKYLFVNNKKPYDATAEVADWSVMQKPVQASASKPFTPKANYSMGDVIKECAGWVITKKTLPDGRIVYNAKIKPETEVNKTQWQEIKNEIYLDTGFKWGRFGAFEKWGQIASEAAVVDNLCRILDKYYKGKQVEEPAQPSAPTPTPAPQPTTELNFKVGDRFSSTKELSLFYEIKEINGRVVNLSVSNIDDGTTNIGLDLDTDINDKIRSGEWVKYEPQQAKQTNFKVGDIIYLSSSPERKYYIKALYSNGQVGVANIETPDAEFIFGSEDLLTSQINDGIIIKDGKYGEPKPTQSKSKEDIQKAINGLQYLADKGNENAIKAIKGLQYLLNK